MNAARTLLYYYLLFHVTAVGDRIIIIKIFEPNPKLGTGDLNVQTAIPYTLLINN